jgi:autotransporter strand-loop-strand O-heptosyltransferase
MIYIKFNYKTTLPREANTPSVTIGGDLLFDYNVKFQIKTSNGLELIKDVQCSTGETVFANYSQKYLDWVISIYHNNSYILEDVFDVTNKVVFIKMDATALGDNIAWIPYVEEFRKTRNCIVICSTFFNDLFKDIYPDILFVKPNTNVDNIYAQYYIGATYDNNIKYSPVNADSVPLQEIPSAILKLPNVELRPPLELLFNKIKQHKKYVCISEYASHENKHWKYNNGWQIIVDYLNSIDYDVYVISKEPTKLNNVINLTGNISLMDRVRTLRNADFFIGLSSGLSWLSWAVNTHVFMVSDVTPPHHEFKSNITRICANNDMLKIDYNAPNITSPDIVIDNIKNYLKLKDIY